MSDQDSGTNILHGNWKASVVDPKLFFFDPATIFLRVLEPAF
jgi:hypothetical protein